MVESARPNNRACQIDKGQHTSSVFGDQIGVVLTVGVMGCAGIGLCCVGVFIRWTPIANGQHNGQ